VSRRPASFPDDTGWPAELRVADLNGDGKPDIAVGSNAYGPTTSPIYLNRGNGPFAPLPPSGYPYADLDIADVNGDRRPDVISAAAGSTDTYAVNLQRSSGEAETEAEAETEVVPQAPASPMSLVNGGRLFGCGRRELPPIGQASDTR
jgi:hypothetical protein